MITRGASRPLIATEAALGAAACDIGCGEGAEGDAAGAEGAMMTCGGEAGVGRSAVEESRSPDTGSDRMTGRGTGVTTGCTGVATGRAGITVGRPTGCAGVTVGCCTGHGACTGW